MRIRTFDRQDLPGVTALWDAAEHVTVVPAAEVERKLQRDPELFLVAEDDGLVGVAMGSYDGRRGYIFRVAVAADRRGQGIARALVDELERRFAVLGVSKVNVLVLSDNVAGREFWTAVGYDAFDDIVLCSKRLDGQAAAGPGC